MAVPFTLPDDDAALEQIIEQIYHLLRVVQQQMQLRRTRDASLQATPRARSNSSRRNRGDQTNDQNALPDFMTLLTSSANPRTDAEVARMLPEAGACCDDEAMKGVVRSSNLKIIGLHWQQVEESIQRQSEGEATSESLLSKLVPTSVTGPIWTAVICVVGWHLLRTR